MAGFVNKVSSLFRGELNGIRRRLVKDPKVKKKLSVLYHNSQALLELKKNCKEELFDYKKIINGKQKFYCKEFYYGNTFYGHSEIIKEYAGYKGRINACIEHGVYFGNTVLQEEAVNSGMNGLLTFGDKRLEHLNGVAKVPVVAVGPYIYYTEPMLSEDKIKQIKRKNGKTLLVFPTHSIDRVETEFDFDSFGKEIQRVVEMQKIDHVMVCLFYKDINIGRDEYYLKRGYQIVCSGYRCDPMFLRRLKTFILLSDYTMSNNIGTNIGYCISLDKPHYTYKQKLSYNAYTRMDMENVMQGNMLDQEMQEVRDAFSDVTEEITPLQRKVCDKYWGTKYIKSKKDMYKILKGFE